MFYHPLGRGRRKMSATSNSSLVIKKIKNGGGDKLAKKAETKLWMDTRMMLVHQNKHGVERKRWPMYVKDETVMATHSIFEQINVGSVQRDGRKSAVSTLHVHCFP